MKQIIISDELHEELFKRAGVIQSVEGRKISIEELICRVFKIKLKNKD